MNVGGATRVVVPRGALARRAYLTGAEAVDVARLTGLRLSTPRHSLRDEPDIDPRDVGRATVILDLTRLDWWDRWRVAWARVGAHYWCYINREG